jgi:hypothetical protein
MKFYSAEWSLIGKKPDLEEVLHEITGVPVPVLKDGINAKVYLSNVASAAQKMSWVSKRSTTRPEDIAYCMMGIFDVNMPLLYGEGREKAFTRLQLEILQKPKDHSLFAWSGDSIEYCGVLASSPSAFAGSANIVTFSENPFPEESVEHYHMTNLGLRITLSLFMPTYFDDEEESTGLRALLECTDQSAKPGVVTIPLRFLGAEGRDQYSRISKGRPLEIVSFCDLHWAERKTIYIHEPSRASEIGTVAKTLSSFFVVQSHLSLEYDRCLWRSGLQSVYPPGCWDTANGLISLPRGQKTIIALHYSTKPGSGLLEDPFERDIVITVYFNSGRYDKMNAGVWETASLTVPLETAYEEMALNVNMEKEGRVWTNPFRHAAQYVQTATLPEVRGSGIEFYLRLGYRTRIIGDKRLYFLDIDCK